MIIVVYGNGDLLLEEPHHVDVSPSLKEVYHAAYDASSLLLEDHIMSITPDQVLKAVRSIQIFARTAALFLVDGLTPLFSSSQIHDNVRVIASLQENFVLPRVVSSSSADGESKGKGQESFKNGKKLATTLGIKPVTNEAQRTLTRAVHNANNTVERLRLLTSEAATNRRECWSGLIGSSPKGPNSSDVSSTSRDDRIACRKKLLPPSPPLLPKHSPTPPPKPYHADDFISPGYTDASQNHRPAGKHPLISPLPPQYYFDCHHPLNLDKLQQTVESLHKQQKLPLTVSPSLASSSRQTSDKQVVTGIESDTRGEQTPDDSKLSPTVVRSTNDTPSKTSHGDASTTCTSDLSTSHRVTLNAEDVKTQLDKGQCDEVWQSVPCVSASPVKEHPLSKQSSPVPVTRLSCASLNGSEHDASEPDASECETDTDDTVSHRRLSDDKYIASVEREAYQQPSIAVSATDVENVVTHLMYGVRKKEITQKEQEVGSCQKKRFPDDHDHARYAYLKEVASSSYFTHLSNTVARRKYEEETRTADDVYDSVSSPSNSVPFFLPEWLRAFVVAVISSASFSSTGNENTTEESEGDENDTGKNKSKILDPGVEKEFVLPFVASVTCSESHQPLRMFITGPPGSGRTTGLNIFSTYILKPFLKGTWYENEKEDVVEESDDELIDPSVTASNVYQGYQVRRVVRHYDHRRGILHGRGAPEGNEHHQQLIMEKHQKYHHSDPDQKLGITGPNQCRKYLEEKLLQRSTSGTDSVWVVPLRMNVLMSSESTDVAVWWCRLAQSLVESLVTAAKGILHSVLDDKDLPLLDDDNEDSYHQDSPDIVASAPSSSIESQIRRLKWFRKLTQPGVASSLCSYIKSAVTHSGSAGRGLGHRNQMHSGDNLVLLPPSLAVLMPPDSQLWPLLLGQVRSEYRASGAADDITTSASLRRCVEAMLRVPLTLRDTFHFRSILYLVDDLDGLGRKVRYIYNSRLGRGHRPRASAFLLEEESRDKKMLPEKTHHKAKQGTQLGVPLQPFLLSHFQQVFVGFVAVLTHAPRMSCSGVVVEVSTENLVPVTTALEDYHLPLHLDIVSRPSTGAPIAQQYTYHEEHSAAPQGNQAVVSIPLAVFAGCPAYLVSYISFVHSLYEVPRSEASETTTLKDRQVVIVRNPSFTSMVLTFMKRIDVALSRWNSK